MFGVIIGTIAAAAATVVKAVAVAGLAIQGLRAIGNSLISLGKALGLIKEKTKVDELGDKALQAEEDGIRPEDFSSYEEYVKRIEEYETDPERSKEISEEDKIRKGMELATGVMLEKYQEFPMEDFCIAVGQNSEYFTDVKMQEIGKLILEDGQTIPDILNYVNGSEKDDAKLASVVDTLTTVEKTVDPDLSDLEAKKAVLGIRK